MLVLSFYMTSDKYICQAQSLQFSVSEHWEISVQTSRCFWTARHLCVRVSGLLWVFQLRAKSEIFVCILKRKSFLSRDSFHKNAFLKSSECVYLFQGYSWHHTFSSSRLEWEDVLGVFCTLVTYTEWPVENSQSLMDLENWFWRRWITFLFYWAFRGLCTRWHRNQPTRPPVKDTCEELWIEIECAIYGEVNVQEQGVKQMHELQDFYLCFSLFCS